MLCRGYSLEVPLYKNVGIRSVSDLLLSTLKGKNLFLEEGTSKGMNLFQGEGTSNEYSQQFYGEMRKVLFLMEIGP